MLWCSSWVFFCAVLSITKCNEKYKELRLEISFINETRIELKKNHENYVACKEDAMVIKAVTIGKNNNNKEMCIKDLRNGTNQDISMQQSITHSCNTKPNCKPEHFPIRQKPTVTCDGTETEPEFINIYYTCKPIDDSKENVWKMVSVQAAQKLTKYFYMVLCTEKSEHHKCNLLSNNKQSQMTILHLNFKSSNSQLNVSERDYFNINNSTMDFSRETFSEFVRNNVTSVVGENITMEIEFKYGGTVWIEVQALCNTTLTCYTIQGQQSNVSAKFNRICENKKASTTVTSFSPSATTKVAKKSTETFTAVRPFTTTTSTTVMIPLLKASTNVISLSISASTSVTSLSTPATTTDTSSINEDSTTIINFKSIAADTATSPVNEELLTVVIVCTVLAVVVLLVVVALTVIYIRRRKRRSKSSIDQSPPDPYLDNMYSGLSVAYTEVDKFKTNNEPTVSNNRSQPGTKSSAVETIPENGIVSQPQDTYTTINTTSQKEIISQPKDTYATINTTSQKDIFSQSQDTYATINTTSQKDIVSQPKDTYATINTTSQKDIVSQPKDTYAIVNKPSKSSFQPSNEIYKSIPETTPVEAPSEAVYSHLSSVRPTGPIETENVYNG